MYFIEHSYAGDPTNWWIPNAAAVEGMLRSSGFDLLSHPEPETWLCQPGSALRAGRYILEQELAGYPEDQPSDEDAHG
jgi:tRNA (mo5U34)-methyltransferase